MARKPEPLFRSPRDTVIVPLGIVTCIAWLIGWTLYVLGCS